MKSLWNDTVRLLLTVRRCRRKEDEVDRWWASVRGFPEGGTVGFGLFMVGSGESLDIPGLSLANTISLYSVSRPRLHNL